MSRPIAEFDFLTPIRLWQHHGLDCAIYASSFCGFNGYARIPEESPQRLEAEMHDIASRERAKANFEQYGSEISLALSNVQGSLGYDAFEDFWPELTYGPDAEGWLGFDTNHYNDDWPDEIINEYLPRCPAAWERYQVHKAAMESVGMKHEPSGRHLPERMRRSWTMESLGERVDALAEFLLAREIVAAAVRERPVSE